MNHDDENTKEYKIKEVLYLGNASAMLIETWLHHNNVREDPNNFDIAYHYIEVDGGMLKDLLNNLELVLNAENNKKHILALFYFPCRYTIPDWVSSVEMFSEAYYAHLKYIYERVEKVINNDPERQLFVYNFSV